MQGATTATTGAGLIQCGGLGGRPGRRAFWEWVLWPISHIQTPVPGPCKELRSAPGRQQAQVQVAHMAGWGLPQGQGVNPSLPHGGSRLRPICAGYGAVLFRRRLGLCPLLSIGKLNPNLCGLCCTLCRGSSSRSSPQGKDSSVGLLGLCQQNLQCKSECPDWAPHLGAKVRIQPISTTPLPRLACPQARPPSPFLQPRSAPSCLSPAFLKSPYCPKSASSRAAYLGSPAAWLGWRESPHSPSASFTATARRALRHVCNCTGLSQPTHISPRAAEKCSLKVIITLSRVQVCNIN